MTTEVGLSPEADQEADPDVARVDRLVEGLLADLPPGSVGDQEFLGAQFDRGLAWVHFPEGLGGLGLNPGLQRRIDSRLQRAGAPFPHPANLIGLGMVAPTLVAHGTPEQQQRYLRPLFTCEEIWCQLFSEPGAGSDVASLASRAVRDGDEWVVNGQKVWTTVAHLSSFGLLIARTDPDLPKHQGMTAFLVDMHARGVDVRPLFQITGEAEFNEVFFTDLRVPEGARLGGVGDGWRVALTTLMNERVAIGGGVPERGRGPIGDALRLWKERWEGRTSAHALALRDRLVAAWCRSEVARLTNLRAAQVRRTGTPGPEGSVAKLAFAEENKRTYELCIDLLGADGMLYSSDYPKVRPKGVAIGTTDVHKAFLRVRANSIEGGTSEVMRNILGERVLGLPGEPRNDKAVAWKDVPRS
ncbi:MAG TPA: acyl-CoA dehydrogenase family protein [Acidimicrobiales bacterium]|jgi:alkylation response protein AidB-like acyl-CoA dehydrogenase|nr:acyl-CoA dehydrogenase family protein [Acidimicrobiales bacterium]